MVNMNVTSCPNCGGLLKYYDTATRVVRQHKRKTTRIQIRRLRCTKCGKLHRELPDNVFPYKQYEMDIIDGVVNGFITPETFGFEDYPCEKTMQRWLTLKIHPPTLSLRVIFHRIQYLSKGGQHRWTPFYFLKDQCQCV